MRKHERLWSMLLYTYTFKVLLCDIIMEILITYELGWLKSSNVLNKQDRAFMLHAILCFVFKIHACTGCIIPVVAALILDCPSPSISPIRWPLPVSFCHFWPGLSPSIFLSMSELTSMKGWSSGTRVSWIISLLDSC